MQKFFNILQKEIKDLLTLKMLLLIMSIFILLFVGQILQRGIGRVTERVDKDAQTTIMPLTLMILIPYFFALVFDPVLMSLGFKNLLNW